MHDAHIKMKDGREFIGPIWDFRPKEGYCTIPSETDEFLFFRDMQSALQYSGRETMASVGAESDLLERARRQGWDGT